MRTGAISLACLLVVAGSSPALEVDFPSLAKQAGEARESNRLDHAVVLYKRALSLRPAWAEGWWYVGNILYEQDAYDGAASALQKLVALRPDDAGALVMLGLSEAKLGRNADALAHLQRGRPHLGGDAALRHVAAFQEGALLLEAGAFGPAQEILGELCRQGLEQPELIMALGSAVLGIAPSKVDSATQAMVRQAGWAEHFAARRDQFPEARRQYQALVAGYPSERNVQFAFGRFLLANHYDDEAVEAFQRELQNSPSHLLARLGIAGLKERTDPAAGLPYAEAAVRLSPKLAEGHYLLGLLLLDTGETPRAVGELETAQRAAPEDARVYFALGKAYAKVHREQDAARARAMFVRLNQGSAKDLP